MPGHLTLSGSASEKQTTGDRSRLRRWASTAVAAAVLLVSLTYNFLFAFQHQHPGLTLSEAWIVIGITCQLSGQDCESEPDHLHLNDRLLEAGGRTRADVRQADSFNPLLDYRAGGIVPLIVERGGEVIQVNWKIPPVSWTTRLLNLVIPFFVYMPFWLAATAALRFGHPADRRTHIMAAAFYLTTLWLATGIVAQSGVGESQQISRSLSWVFPAVYIHFHLLLPGPLLGRCWREVLVPLYALAFAAVVLQIAGFASRDARISAILVAAVASLGLLLYRSFADTPAANRLAARLMLFGGLVAFGPGLLLWALPVFLNLTPANVLTYGLIYTALPSLPLFYTYALWKHRLGFLEARANTLLSVYAVLLIYLTVLSLVLLANSPLVTAQSEVLPFLLMAGLALALAIVTVRGPLAGFFDLLTYGRRRDPERLFKSFLEHLPQTGDLAGLGNVLGQQVLPALNIEQSAIAIFDGEGATTVYSHGLPHGALPVDAAELHPILGQAGRYLASDGGSGLPDSLGWVRAALPLLTHRETLGVWLFGRRYPDNFYTQADLDLLRLVAIEVAVALQNARLLLSLEQELRDRQRSEEAAAQYANRLKLLREIDQAVLALAPPATSAAQVLERLRDLVPYDRASVLLFDREHGHATVLTIAGERLGGIRPGQKLGADEYTLPEELLAGDVSLVHDLETLANPTPSRRAMRELGLRSLLNAPLVASGELIGSLNLLSARPQAYRPEHIEIGREVANSLAVAIQNERLIAAATLYSSDLKQLSSRLLTAQERERKWISFELHDEIGQVVTAITLKLAEIERAVTEPGSAVPSDLLAETRELVARVMEQIRSLSRDLRPSMLQDLGLIPTLNWYVNRYRTQTGIQVDFEADLLLARPDENVESALYRILQEALTNVARHAQAKNVHLELYQRDGTMTVDIHDDGIGFGDKVLESSPTNEHGIGLVAIRERAAALGGRAVIRSAPGKGTHIHVEVPLERESNGRDYSFAG